MSVEVGKSGRIVLPKAFRDKYGLKEGSRLIVRDHNGQLVLLPVTTYEKAAEALYGSIVVEHPIEDPKELARTHIRKRLVEEHR